MRRSAFALLATALLSTHALADYSFPLPAGTYTDSAAVNAATPVRIQSDTQTQAKLSLADRTIRLDATWGALPKDATKASLSLPFDRHGSPQDFSGVRAISFKYRTSANVSIEVTPNSQTYSGADNGVMMLAAYGPSTGGKTVSVSLPDAIDYFPWMVHKFPGDVNYTWDDVKASIRSLDFAIRPAYDTLNDTLLAKSAWIEISDIKLLGLFGPDDDYNWLSAMGSGCECPNLSFPLSGFESPTPGLNTQGGEWYTFSDAYASSSARGTSFVKIDSSTDPQGIAYLPGKEDSLATAGVTAVLDRGLSGKFSGAGWAGLGTRFQDIDGNYTYFNLAAYPNRLRAMSFFLSIPEDLDTANIAGIALKIHGRPGLIAEHLAFRVGIDPRKFSNREVCVDFSQFRQPRQSGNPPATLPPEVRDFEWILQLKDTSARAKPSSFALGNVRLWGVKEYDGDPSCGQVGIPSSPARPASFSAHYAHGLVLSYALDGASHSKIEVLRLDGTKIATFVHGAQASNLSLPLNLARGTYLAVVQGGGQKLVAPFAVAQ